MRVLFVCSGGMSSSIVVNALKHEAQKHQLEIDVLAVGSEQFALEVHNGWDIAMIAPQVRHRYALFKAAADQAGVICEMIPPQSYSPLGGPSLLHQIRTRLGLH